MRDAYQDVVGLQVSVENIALAHQTQSQEHLLSVGSNSFQVDAHVTSEFLQDFTQVDAQILKDHAKMTFVFEVPLESNHMFLVLWIGLVDLLKNLYLLHTGFSPTKS